MTDQETETVIKTWIFLDIYNQHRLHGKRCGLTSIESILQEALQYYEKNIGTGPHQDPAPADIPTGTNRNDQEHIP